MSALSEIRAKRAQLRFQMEQLEGYEGMAETHLLACEDALLSAQNAVRDAKQAKKDIEEDLLRLMAGEEKLAAAEVFLAAMEDDNELPAPPPVIAVVEPAPVLPPAPPEPERFRLWSETGGNISEMSRRIIASRPGRHFSCGELAVAVMKEIPATAFSSTSVQKTSKVIYQAMRVSVERGSVRKLTTMNGDVYQAVPQVER